MIRKGNLYFFVILLFLNACSSIPKNTADGCSIFSERYLWYKHAKKAEQKWGTPIYIQLAFIKMESDFDWLARPERLKIFKVIPYKRPSSSFGATRTRFKDSVDFIGWYTNKTEKLLKISKKNAFRQYIAYHEGWGNYKKYKEKPKVILLAKKVQQQSDKYKSQLNKCSKSLNRKKYIIF